MLQITSIKNGIVLDHIKSGVGMKIFKYLHLSEMGNQVALIINAESKKNGKNEKQSGLNKFIIYLLWSRYTLFVYRLFLADKFCNNYFEK